MTKKEVIRFLILRSIGNFLVLFSLFGFFATFGPTIFYEFQFRVAQARGVHYTVAKTQATTSALGELLKKERAQNNVQQSGATGFGKILTGPTEQVIVPVDTNFGIVIPKIGANARVLPNIDPSNESAFLPALQEGVAHAKGTVFPGQKGHIYLFAHSTDNFWNVGRYNALFYLLKELTPGDQVFVFFENVRHNYVVYDTKIVEGNDVSYLMDSQKVDKEVLILQTCWPPGTSWKRLLVFAKPESK